MTISIRLFALLRKYLPRHATGNECTVEIEPGDTVLDVIHSLNIPVNIPKIILVNGQHVSLDSKEPLADGEIVSIFPLMAGG